MSKSIDLSKQYTADNRYDVIHLLTALPERPRSRASSSSSLSSSWSIPSDAEETFELSSDEELAEHARNRRQAWVDGLREARLREREREDEETEAKRTADAEKAEGEAVGLATCAMANDAAPRRCAAPHATYCKVTCCVA